MPRVELPLPLGYYEDTSKPVSVQTCKNFYPYILPAGVSGTNIALKGAHGIEQFATTNSNAARGSILFKNQAYSVQGTELYRINSDGTSNALGTITGTGLVSLAVSDTQLCILIPGSTGYIFTTDPDTLTTITDLDFTANGNPQQVTFKDGYFIFFTDTNRFIISAINDGLSYNALDFGTAEANPDPMNAIHVSNNQLFIAGTTTTEVFQNIGGSSFPFQTIRGALIPKGITAKFAIVNADNTFFFIGKGEGESNSIWRYTGSSAQRISTGPIDSILQTLSNAELNEVIGTAYSINESFYVNFHLKNSTFVYDIVASSSAGRPIWHERVSRNDADQEINWRVNGVINAYGKTLVTDTQGGIIGVINSDLFTEYNERIVSEAILSPVISKGYGSIHSRLEVICEPGVSTASGDDSDSKIEMAFSDNLGFTFSTFNQAPLGAQGDRNTRQIFYNIGRASRERYYKLRMSDKVKKTIVNTFLDIQTRS